jgi:hypothetical protein
MTALFLGILSPGSSLNVSVGSQIIKRVRAIVPKTPPAPATSSFS